MGCRIKNFYGRVPAIGNIEPALAVNGAADRMGKFIRAGTPGAVASAPYIRRSGRVNVVDVGNIILEHAVLIGIKDIKIVSS
jgi:hypothetical protein